MSAFSLFILLCEERSVLAPCMNENLQRILLTLSCWRAVSLLVEAVCTRPPGRNHILRDWPPNQDSIFQSLSENTRGSLETDRRLRSRKEQRRLR